jgi:TonB family protein
MRYHFPFIWSLFLGLLAGSAAGQSTSAPTDTTSHKEYTYTEKMPVFPGLEPGDSARTTAQRLIKFLNDSLTYPPRALRDGVSGRVFFSFTVNAEGRTVDIKLVKGIRADVDAEALRNARRLTRIRWKPGTQNGRPVSVSFTAPLTFSIQQSAAHPAPLNDSLETLVNRNRPPSHKLLPVLEPWGAYQRTILPGLGVVYGSCIQRLGFSSGSLAQYIRVVNVSTGRIFSFTVKPALRSRKENSFCYALPPGRYALYCYDFAASKWYGTELYTEGLQKAGAAAGIQPLSVTRYLFTVAPGGLHYLGTWNLEQANTLVISNDKSTLDAQLAPHYKHLRFDEAIPTLPR